VIKRQLRRGLLGDLKSTFESQGLQFLDISEIINEKERRSSLASTSAAPMNTEGADQVAQSGGPEGA
jgi:hypothetical protein